MNSKLKLLVFGMLFYIIACQSNNAEKLKSENLSGLELFKKYCTNCHGIDGTLMTNGARNLQLSELSLDERILVITKGRNIMTRFETVLTPEQIEVVAKYTLELKVMENHGK